MDKNQGYAILKAVMLENGRGFALGEHPTAPSRYVTWACYDDKDGQRQYEWGHYGNDRTAMEQDFTDRVQDYQRIYNVGIRQTEAPGLYKYYSGMVRELLGAGSLFGVAILPETANMLLFILPPGAFLTLGYLIALVNKFRKS